MEYKELYYYLEHAGKDPSRLIFEDELTGLFNRRFLFHYFKSKISWEALQEQPVSLIMVDMDHFKTINDTHGHDVGDQVLVWMAGLLKEVAGEENLPIRYAGDEFMVLMPTAEKQEAIHLGERLIQLVHDKPAELKEGGGVITVTLSLGVATAPIDAQDEKLLIQKADTALYYAKKTGRDRLAIAGDVAPQDVFVKTALHQMGQVKIAGRKKQLATVAEALKRFGRRQSQFLVVEGAAGMGKSMFLETLQRSLERSKSILQVKVAGAAQDLYRPYYLMGNVLVELLKLQDDKGEGVLDGFTPEERTCLYPILPQLSKDESARQIDEKVYREGVFASLVKLFEALVKSKHTVLLIDDMHLSDEATLLLLRRLILRQGVPLFVCGAAPPLTGEAPDRGSSDILRRFSAAHGREIQLLRVSLPPLSASDIAAHLKDIFPRVSLPESFGDILEQLTQGNPLFLSEIVRKLVMDGKISLTGDHWVVQPLEEGYLPRSLEEIVRHKISALDKESRELLNQVSVIGDKISISALTGSTERSDAQIQEFVDMAVSQGIISSDFQVNDETIRFLSTRVMDITYGDISEDLRQELHEKVGNYQQSLYERDLLPSAATLAYHFKRSSNQEKANSYERIQWALDHEVFSAEEAVGYSGESPLQARPQELPLDPDSIQQVPGILRRMLLAVRNVKLYPPGSRPILVANEQIKEAIDRVLDRCEFLTLFQVENSLFVNGEAIEIDEFKGTADSFLKFLSQMELKGLGFKRGLNIEEICLLIDTFGQLKREAAQKDFWQGLAAEKKFRHVELTQVQYAVRTEEGGEGDGKETLSFSSPPVAAEDRLGSEQAACIPEFMRSLLHSAKSIKLYPIRSRAIESAINKLMDSLRRVLATLQALTLARVGDSLLVNGEKFDFAEFQLVAQGFLRFLDSLSLKSITFLQEITTVEMRMFIDALGHLPPSGVDGTFWARVAKEKRLGSILFDHRLYYEAKLFSGASDSGGFEARAFHKEGGIPDKVQPEESVEGPLDESPEVIVDLLLKEDGRGAARLIEDLFQDYKGKSSPERQEVIRRCANMMGGLNIGLQNQFAKLIAEPLLDALAAEEEPQVLRPLADLLRLSATVILQFADYSQATRIFLHLQNRSKVFKDGKPQKAEGVEEIPVYSLSPENQKIVLEDFQSAEPLRRQCAAQLLGSLGDAALPLLKDVVKNEKDLRIRRTAADLMAQHGEGAAKLLKQELTLAGTSGERLRILEVIDRVSQELEAELTFAFGDESPRVREEAYRIAERLNNEKVAKLLSDFAESENVPVAVGAIKCLGRMKQNGAREKLLSLLRSTRAQEKLIACCQSLGQIGDSAAVEPLCKILLPGRLERILFWRERYGDDVRANAAWALARIDHPKVKEILTACLEDRDPRIREAALSVISLERSPSEPSGNKKPGGQGSVEKQP